MKCNLIVSTNEVTIRDYTLIEDSGILAHININFSPGISFGYEDDEERPGKQMIVIKGGNLEALLKWLAFVELRVKVVT